MAAFGPHPADTVFHRALKKEFDIIVSMYHDQGLGPLKTLAFDSGINVTVGLPIIRTSPDHGTAYDIAWENRSDPRSMEMAIRAALRLKLPEDQAVPG
jgi:4-hydroxythreonine-4-phosphate dehydrogenase